MGFREIDAAQKEGQFLGSELHGWSIRGGPCEGAGLEALGAEPPSVAVPEEDLETVTAGVGEDEEMAREGIELEGVPDHTGEGVEGLPQICFTRREKHPGGGEETQHDPSKLRKGRTDEGSTSAVNRNRIPLGATISSHAVGADAGGMDRAREVRQSRGAQGRCQAGGQSRLTDKIPAGDSLF